MHIGHTDIDTCRPTHRDNTLENTYYRLDTHTHTPTHSHIHKQLQHTHTNARTLIIAIKHSKTLNTYKRTCTTQAFNTKEKNNTHKYTRSLWPV